MLSALEVRPLSESELDSIRTIDRSELIEQQYFVAEDKLQIRSVKYDVKGFDSNELDQLIANQNDIRHSGGQVLGAYLDSILAGVVSIDARLFGNENQFSKMDILYIDANHRGNSIGKQLVQRAQVIASDFGAKKLYISATPTKTTVDFYMNLGATLIPTPNQKLFNLEPEDIHLELKAIAQ